MKTLRKTLPITAAAMALSLTASAGAADESLQYTIERVTFTSGGETLVGNLYIPTGVDARNRVEGVVVTGAWTTIKEHMAGTYAASMAERGQVALAFDFRTWGESGGATRSLEDPAMKTQDIIAAADFLSRRPEVNGVNGLGICASAGYMAAAASRSSTIGTVALVAPWLHDAAIVETVYGGKEGVARLIEKGRAASAHEAATGEPQLIPAAGPAGSNALMPGAPYYTEPGLGLIPEWSNTFNLASWEGWLTFDAIAVAPRLSQPLLIVHSEAAAIPQGAKAFYSQVTSDKDELWLAGVTQFDFYHRSVPVNVAGDAAAAFFNRH